MSLNIQDLIDTGFSGDIAIPATEELRGYEADAYATWAMADGSEVMAPVFLGTIRFPDLDNETGVMVGVTLTVLGDQPFIGQSILRNFTITLDHGRKVILEP
jgi:predicted aspartyl protease